MDTLNKNDLLSDFEKYSKLIESGAIFIYPTDTVYGVGCDARNETGVMKIKQMKQRYKPLSVIAPSKKWVEDNFVILEKHKHWLDKLPGKYTLVLEAKNDVLPITVSGGKKIGIRIPNHWISGFVERLGFPVITTSVNIAGIEPLTNAEQLGETNYDTFKDADFFVDEGRINGSRSAVVDLTGEREFYLRM